MAQSAAKWYQCGKPIIYVDTASGNKWEGPWWVCRRYVGHPGECNFLADGSDEIDKAMLLWNARETSMPVSSSTRTKLAKRT